MYDIGSLKPRRHKVKVVVLSHGDAWCNPLEPLARQSLWEFEGGDQGWMWDWEKAHHDVPKLDALVVEVKPMFLHV
jgi:hypothetical protein